MNLQQHNEVDDLFRSKLDRFEEEPSAAVWAGISAELPGKPARKGYIPFLRVAASIAILIAAGLLLLPKNDEKTGNAKTSHLAQNNVLKPSVIIHQQEAADRQSVKKSVQPQIANFQSQRIAVVRQANSKHQIKLLQAQQTSGPDTTEALVRDQLPVLAAVAEKPIIMNKPVVPDNNVPLNIKVNNDITPDIAIKPAAVLASIVPKAAAGKKTRIRGLGGLINAAVAIVDKREDKVIEFTNNDEGDTITGINLGVIKIKKNQ